MPRFSELDHWFDCPYRHGCPYLEGLPPKWVWEHSQQVNGTACHYEYQLEQLHQQLDQERRQRRELERENQEVRAQLQALHRRQFKGRRKPAEPSPESPPSERKKRGAPAGHPAWVRPQPK